MKASSSHFPSWLWIALALTLPAAARPPVAGAWQSFSKAASARTWVLESYDTGDYTIPGWAGPDIDDNPFIFSFYEGDEAIAFVTDSSVSGDTLTGDFTAQNIRGIGFDAFFDPSELDFLDVVVYANGPKGRRFYFSQVRVDSDFNNGEDWYLMDFLFSDRWYYFENPNDTNPVAFYPDQRFRATIEEIDLRFFPKSGIRTESYVGIDNVILLPTVEAPKLQTSLSGGQFRLSFTPRPGTICSVQKLMEPAMTWQDVSGQTGITAGRTYQTPLSGPRGIFRVDAREHLTPVADP